MPEQDGTSVNEKCLKRIGTTEVTTMIFSNSPLSQKSTLTDPKVSCMISRWICQEKHKKSNMSSSSKKGGLSSLVDFVALMPRSSMVLVEVS